MSGGFGAFPGPPLPRWADLVLLPLLNLALALLLAAVVVLIAGASPLAAVTSLIDGAFGGAEAISYTLYYATDLIFAGLAVAVAFHAGLFNIGVEGQAMLAGVGVALACLRLAFLPGVLLVPAAIIASALFGAAWAAIPGWLQARRGSHVVITTIMFNFIASALLVWLLAEVMIAPGSMEPGTPTFAGKAALPSLATLGLPVGAAPLNASFLLALAALVLVWLFVWHTRWGYALRVVGASPRAAVYAGIAPERQILRAMLLSGALAGGIAVNEAMGAQHRLLLGFTGGYGFTGIAVALMGRNHPLGIAIAAVLFGALYQGGAEMSFDLPNISSDLVVAVQGLVILTTGGMPFLLRPLLARLLARLVGRRAA